MTNTTTTANEMKALLKKWNPGVQDVTIENGIVSVFCRSAKAVHGVTVDLLRSRGFRSVKATQSGKALIVHAIPA